MQPDHHPRPEEIDARFAQIVQQEDWHPDWSAPPRPPRRSNVKRWLTVTGLVFVVFLVGVTGLFLAILDTRAPQTTAAEDPVVQRIRDSLAKQRDALLAGDESAYLAILDQAADGGDREALARQFRSLRAMKVAAWRDGVGVLSAQPEGRWSVEVASYACFVTAPCEDGQAVARTVWRVSDSAATLVDWEPARQPHPWQVSELVSASGQRTVVATTQEHASKLPAVLREAEKAALVADRFAREKPPSRYVIYYAGRTEWKTWFGWSPSQWTGAAAFSVSDDRYEVMLSGENMDSNSLAGHLRHEMTHASSLPGRHENDDRLWWLVEGIAEYAEADGLPIRHHPGLQEAQKVLAASTTGFEVDKPGDDADVDNVGGAYAVAFLAARCLAERFGEAQFADFFHVVLHDGKTLSEASTIVFGVDWTGLRADCLAYIATASR